LVQQQDTTKGKVNITIKKGHLKDTYLECGERVKKSEGRKKKIQTVIEKKNGEPAGGGQKKKGRGEKMGSKMGGGGLWKKNNFEHGHHKGYKRGKHLEKNIETNSQGL